MKKEVYRKQNLINNDFRNRFKSPPKILDRFLID